MSFMTLTFLTFCIIVFVAYFIMPQKLQWVVLLIANYIFYMWSSYYNIIYILITTLSTYYSAVIIEKSNNKYNEYKQEHLDLKEDIKKYKERTKRFQLLTLTLCLILNFGLLVFFKYGRDVISAINQIAYLTNSKNIPYYSIVIPLGISYYTFQSTSYIIDVYRGKYKAEHNLARFALFVSYFPQLVQGPISRYDDLGERLFAGNRFNFENFKFGIERTIWGLFKKLVIADRISIMTESIFSNYTNYSGLYIIFVASFYSIQVYADFSGGMDIACGISESLGIKLVDNFKRPFFADNLSEYWRRWHISLNDWLRDYIFYPVTLSKLFVKIGKISRKYLGKRVGKYFATYVATFVVRTINAIWHGGSAKYFINGFYNGILIILSMQFEPLFTKIKKVLKVKESSLGWKLFCIIRTFLLISYGRIIVKAQNAAAGWDMIKSSFKNFNPWIFFDGSLYDLGISQKEFRVLLLAIFVLFIVSLLQEKGIRIREKIEEQDMLVRWGLYYLAIVSVILFGVYGIGYDAAGFIYMQF